MAKEMMFQIYSHDSLEKETHERFASQKPKKNVTNLFGLIPKKIEKRRKSCRTPKDPTFMYCNSNLFPHLKWPQRLLGSWGLTCRADCRGVQGARPVDA